MHILTPCTLLLLGAARRPTLLRNGGTDGWVELVGTGNGTWAITLHPGAFCYTCIRTTAQLRFLSRMAAAPSAFNSFKQV